jgi:hypothetical protein
MDFRIYTADPKQKLDSYRRGIYFEGNKLRFVHFPYTIKVVENYSSSSIEVIRSLDELENLVILMRKDREKIKRGLSIGNFRLVEINRLDLARFIACCEQEENTDNKNTKRNLGIKINQFARNLLDETRKRVDCYIPEEVYRISAKNLFP